MKPRVDPSSCAAPLKAGMRHQDFRLLRPAQSAIINHGLQNTALGVHHSGCICFYLQPDPGSKTSSSVPPSLAPPPGAGAGEGCMKGCKDSPASPHPPPGGQQWAPATAGLRLQTPHPHCQVHTGACWRVVSGARGGPGHPTSLYKQEPSSEAST